MQVEQVIYNLRGSSRNTLVVGMENNKEFSEYHEPYEPHLCELVFDLTAYKDVLETDEEVSLGYLEVTVLDLRHIYDNHKYSPAYIIDCHSDCLVNSMADLYDLSSMELHKSIRKFSKYPEDLGDYATIALIEVLYIEEGFRGQGIGSKILEDLAQTLQFFCNLKVDILITEPTPLIKSGDTLVDIEDKKLKAKLRQFYKNQCFLPISKNSIRMFKFVGKEERVFKTFKGKGENP